MSNKLNIDELYDKIEACWLGKNIGGTLGMPYEGVKDKLSIDNVDEVGKNGPLPNDDLDLQLLNLHAIEENGQFLSTKELSSEWAEHVFFPYDEYGYALANIRKNISSPLSGSYNNPFVDCMGSCIRSELWAAIAPGRPEIASYFAYQDANVDHAGGEGVYGEQFFAVLESMAYVNNDIAEILYKSLEYIPNDCRVYKAVFDTIKWYEKGVSYHQIRELILEKYGNDNFTDSPQNIAFTIVALLYCENFEDGLLKALNLGYDTDCTCATFGSIYGILYGTKCIPDKLKKAVDSHIFISPEVKGFHYPQTIEELTNRTISIYNKLVDSGIDFSKFELNNSSTNQVFYLPHNNSFNNSLNVRINTVGNESVVNNKDKEIEITYLNTTDGIWEFNSYIDDNKSENYTIKLNPGEEETVKHHIIGKDDGNMVANYDLHICRIHNGELWTTYKLNFVLPVASLWNINGSNLYFNDSCIDFNCSGRNIAKTTLHIPSDREIKLIASSNSPVTVSLNGDKIINCEKATAFLPAFHRCPEEQCKSFYIKKGIYDVEVTVESNNKDSKFMLLPVSPNDKIGGKNSYFIDCTIGNDI